MSAGRATHRQAYDGVVVAVPVTIPYERYSIRSAQWWIGRALGEILQRSGLRKRDIDGFSVTSFSQVPDSAAPLTQHFGISPRWLDQIPCGGASGIMALRRAARAVQVHDADFVVCIAGDTNSIHSFRQMLPTFTSFTEDAVYPYGGGGPNGSFALLTDYYMRKFGARREDFGKLCIAQRDNARRFPHALIQKPLTMEDYLGARPIASPLALFDCVMPCAGAEAFLVTRDDLAASLNLKTARVLATIERHNAFPDDPIQIRGGWAMDSAELWAMAGITQAAVDFVETYDDYPLISMMQFEDLGFCEKGEGPDFVRHHSFTNDGSFPHNTSGGQLSVGQAGAAGGSLGLVEAIRQVTGQTLGAPVPDARIGLVSGFGMINYDRGLCSSAAILAQSESI
jgi:acetyl-CoA acetyltransferase